MPVREEWTVSQPHYHAAIERSGMTAEYVETVLGKVGVALSYSNVKVEPLPCHPGIFVIPTPHLIHQGDTASLYYAENGLGKNHMWVVLNRETKELSDVRGAEFLKMRAITNWVIEKLNQDVVVAYWNTPQLGHLENRFVIEIIPPKKSNTLNLYNKVQCHKWVQGRERFTHLPKMIDEVVTQKNVAEWKNQLPMGQITLPRQSDPESEIIWLCTQTRRGAAALNLVDEIFRKLCHHNAVVERNILSAGILLADVTHTQAGCAFCNPKVIENQLVADSKELYVLLNYKPASEADFLIVPKRHVKSSKDLTIDEHLDMYIAAQHVTRVIKEMFGRTDIAIYFQDGMGVGQTVMHAHLHVTLQADPLRMLFRCINYEDKKPLSKDELVELKQRYIEKF